VSKRLFAVGAALATCVLVAQGAQAKSLEDILKEKGVITEADYKEVVKSKPFDYKLGKGFTFTSADEKFQFSIGGRMQFRYTFMDYDNESVTSTGAVAHDSSKFEAKRIRLIAQGYAYSKNLTYKMEIDPVQLAQNDGRGGLLDCFLNYKFMDELQLKIGQQKIQYGYTIIQSDGALMFVDRVPWIGRMAPSYEIGAFAYGKVFNGLMDYALSVTNGDGMTTSSDYNRNAFAARVAFSPLGAMANDEPDLAISQKPLFTVGANYFYNNLGRTEGSTSTTYTSVWNNHQEIHNYGFDTHFKWMGLAVQGEVLFSQGDNRTTAATDRAMGWYGQAGYMITPKIGVALRYSQYDRNRDVGNDLQSEQIGAVSYYFDKHNLKLQADVGNIHTQRATGSTDDMQYRIQAQLIF
jgi:phosphate-selective porin OprO/OprP